MSLSPAQKALKEEFLSQRGVWSPQWDTLLRLDTNYFAAYLKFRDVPTSAQYLSPKIQELILLSVSACCTTMFLPGIEAHTHAALEAGATKDEILEVLALTSVCGIHSISVGVPVLLDILEEEGRQGESVSTEMTARKQELKNDFEAKRGYWGATWDNLLNLDPDFFAAYTTFSGEPFRKVPGKNVLDSKIKELIYCAFDACATHMYAPGLKLHMQNARRYGASVQEIMQVLELAALVGVHSSLVGGQVLDRLVKERTVREIHRSAGEGVVT